MFYSNIILLCSLE